MSELRTAKKSLLIFLYGPPASGKSTIGKLLADSLALPFVDHDQRIEVDTGLTIAEIFEGEGETGFRKREREMLRKILRLERGVIALGGGALIDHENRSLVEQAGQIICLSAPPEALLERVGTTQTVRPLIAAGREERASSEKLVNLLTQRENHYISFTNQIDTLSNSPEQVVWEIQIQLGVFHLREMANSGVRVPSAESENARPHPVGYDVRVHSGALDDIGSMLVQLNLKGPIALVTDENVAAFYLSRTIKDIRASGFAVQPLIVNKKHPL